MKMVTEKSWNMKKWPKVIEFCDSVMEFNQVCPQLILNLYFYGSPLRSRQSAFSDIFHKFKIGERDGHGKL